MITVKLLKDFGGKTAGTEVDFEDAIAKSLVETGIAEMKDGDPVQSAVSTALKGFRDGIREIVTEEVNAATKEIGSGSGIEIGQDRSMPRGGYKCFGEFALDVKKLSTDRDVTPAMKEWRKKAAAGQNSTDDSVLIPEEFSSRLLEVAKEVAIVRPRATTVPMATSTLKIPALHFNTTDEDTGEVIGGSSVTVTRAPEAGTISPSQAGFAQVTLTATKQVAMVVGTGEILADSVISLESFLSKAAGEAIAQAEDSDFLTGSGMDEPEGALNANCIIEVDKEGAQAANTIQFLNICKIYARVYPASKARGVWVASHDTFSALATMTVGSATVTQPVWIPSQDASLAPNGTIFGRPLILSEKVPALSEAGDIGFYDFSQYLIGQRGGLNVAQSIHLYFDTDQVAWRFIQRNDGKAWWMSSYQPDNGAATMSPFVRLGAR